MALVPIHQHTATLVKVTLIATQLGWEALKSIREWWRGEISGARCAKNIIDGSAAILGGVGGGYVGGIIGTAVAPGVGTLIGAGIGALIGGVGVGALVKILTDEIFDLAPSVALEKAYRFVGLSHHCSNSDVNSAYRRLSLTYHPDKGGEKENWLKLQVYVEIIRQARGE